MKTKVNCNTCESLIIHKRKMKKVGKNVRSIWMFVCEKSSIFIGTHSVDNKDLHTNNVPDIKAPYACPKRLELRKQGREDKFELSI